MNERIKELALQAGIELGGERGDEAWQNLVIFEKKDLEKFAELIVEECIREIVYKSVELLDIDFYPHYQERLKKHFGVEE